MPQKDTSKSKAGAKKKVTLPKSGKQTVDKDGSKAKAGAKKKVTSETQKSPKSGKQTADKDGRK